MHDKNNNTVQYCCTLVLHDLTVLKVYEYINSRIIVVSIEVGTI
jgi:hypothetical protein